MLLAPALALVALTALADAWSTGGFRHSTCLANATAPGERRNVTVAGVSQPLIIGSPFWDAAFVQSLIMQIIFQDVLGVQVELVKHDGTRIAIRESYNCDTHITLGLSLDSSLEALEQQLKRDHDEKVPIDLGTMPYVTYDAFYLKEEIVQAAMQQEHLPLDYYLSYSHPRVDITQFFDRPENISHDNMEACWHQQLWIRYDGYEAATGDYNSRCVSTYWWYSPACRWNTARCIPAILDSVGLSQMMQYTYWWNLPVAFAFIKDAATYRQRVRDTRALFSWSFPDASFLDLNTSRLSFPAYDERLWSAGIYKTDWPNQAVRKVGCRQLESRDSEGVAQLAATVANMRLIPQDVMELLRASLDQSLETVACEWLKARSVPWETWIASSTACLDGQGLVAENGSFADARAEAASCRWCSPGRKSVRVRDAEGPTYRCEGCGAGQFQELMGAVACEPCGMGEFAGQNGTSSCELCPLGRYAPERGRAECDACPPGFVTALRGVVGFADCICPQGLYRDGAARDSCLPCPGGMTCPEGSDELGYGREHAQGLATVPLLLPGYWSIAEMPFEIFNCESPLRCVGGRPGRACASRLTRQACTQCEAGYHWVDTECLACADSEAMSMATASSALVGFVIAIRLLYQMSKSDYRSWNGWTQALSSAMFLVINHYQTTNAVRQTSLGLPDNVWNMFETFAFFNEGMTVVVNPCNGVRTFLQQLTMQSIAPIFVFCVYALVWGVSKLLGLWCPSAAMDIDRTSEGFFSLMLTFFGGIAEGAFTIFKCGTNPNGSYTLLKDRSIQCYGEEWQSLAVIGLLAVLCWCVGFGLLFARAIYLAPRYFHEERMRRRWRFLFIRYRPDVHWWSLVFVAKGVLVNLGSAVMATGIGQLFWIEACLLIYVNLSAIYKPWRHILNSIFDVWMHVCLLVTCSLTMWFARDGSQNPAQGDMIGRGILSASLFGMSLPMPLFIAIIMYRQFAASAKRRKARSIEGILDAISRAGRARRDECETLLRGLHETDFQIMLSFMRLLNTELSHTYSRGGYSVYALKKSVVVGGELEEEAGGSGSEDEEALEAVPKPTEVTFTRIDV